MMGDEMAFRFKETELKESKKKSVVKPDASKD